MNAIRSHIVCIIDRSGSMQPISGDAIGGYNSFLEKQSQLPGEAVVTLVLFDHEYSRVCWAHPLDKAPLLDAGSYIPRGSTALLDAIGRTIDDVREIGTVPPGFRTQTEADKVIVVILTDGMENASRNYSQADIAQRIDKMRQEYGWEFVYLGANQDAISVARSMNISTETSASFEHSREGMRAACAMMDEQVMYSRSFLRTADDDAAGSKQ
ncbi:MAG: hypothetical protein WAV84_08480 [Bacteroidota bacterium]